MRFFKILFCLGITIICLNSKAQWTSSSNNIYYDSGYVGINTTSPENNLDVKGTLLLRRLGNADVNNPLKNSGTISLQSGFWESSSAQTSKWNLLSKRVFGFYWGDNNKNKSKFVIAEDNGVERFVLDDNGEFDMNNNYGQTILNYNPYYSRLNIP
ncbi:MAG TPA: hypothetical protein VK498_12250, partial [Ferruginibacter sp.]|nr:hypothetical protein [Ferruginibacter sp.]